MSPIKTLLVGILLLSPYGDAKQNPQTDLTAPTLDRNQQLLMRVQHLIDQFYVESVEPQALLDGALKGMLEVLDGHSGYLQPQTLALLQDNNRGHYYGYGIEVAADDDQIRIITPLAGSTAAAAGVQPGDILLQVDDLVASAKQLEPLVAYIKQSSIDDRTIRLVLQRSPKEPPLRLQIAPAPITVNSSSWEVLDEQVGYIKISSFTHRTASEVRRGAQAFAQLPLSGLVLDLRNNPGGLLESAVQVADMFLKEGIIVTTHGRFYEANTDYHANRLTFFNGLPTVVLINQGSASAAEILAGALQDRGRATLMGERTYGKGTVQSLIPLVGYGGAIKLTTAHYATPKGTFIDQHGIMPDMPLSIPPKVNIVRTMETPWQWKHDPQLFAAFDYLTED